MLPCVSVRIELRAINDNELYCWQVDRGDRPAGTERVDGHSSFISLSLFLSRLVFALPGPLLSFHKARVDCDSYKCEQKHHFLLFCLTQRMLWLAQMAAE